MVVDQVDFNNNIFKLSMISKNKILLLLFFFSLVVSQINTNTENDFNLFVSSLNSYNQNFGLSKSELDIKNIEQYNQQIFITISCGRNNYKSTIATCSYFLGNIFKTIGSFNSKSVTIILYVESFENTRFISETLVETFIKIANKEINISNFVNNLILIKESIN